MYKVLYGIPAMNEEIVIDEEVADGEDPWCDFSLNYNPIYNYYFFEFETFLAFKEKDSCRNWIIECLSGLTDYMESHGYDISKEINLYDAFTKGINVNTKFDTIEEAYAWLKMMVFGFHGQGL